MEQLLFTSFVFTAGKSLPHCFMYRLSSIGSFVRITSERIKATFTSLIFSKLSVLILPFNYPESWLVNVFGFISACAFKDIYLFRMLFGVQKVILTFNLLWSFSLKKETVPLSLIFCALITISRNISPTWWYIVKKFSAILTCIWINQINEIECYRSWGYWVLLSFFYLQLKVIAR